VTSDINRAINAAFNKQGIEIPFPQRDVHFRGPLKIVRDSELPPEAPDGGASPPE
jgi:small-conductance mechanosensitive channel